jgi:hypothetical protein
VASSLFGVEPLFDVLPDAPVVPIVFFRFPEGCDEDQQQENPDDDASKFMAVWVGDRQLVFRPDCRAFVWISRQGGLWS